MSRSIGRVVARGSKKTFYRRAAVSVFTGLPARPAGGLLPGAFVLGAVLLAILLAPLLSVPARAAVPEVAPTPPMGWNSWLTYGTSVREDEVKANTDVLADRLKPYGWEYVVVDIQWYEPNAQAHGYRPNARLEMDGSGRLIPAANRFPSAADGQGFKPLADYVHSKGLKFGIHILRGIPRQAVAQNAPITGTNLHAGDVVDTNSLCKWNTDMYGVDMSKPGAQAYYDSIVALYAQWGVDFIKADDMARPYHKAEVEALHRAILKSGRPMVLSLSPGPAPLAEAASLRENAEMWRVEDDLWDDWGAVKNMYSRIESWSGLVEVGHWPDADLLPLGHFGIRAEKGTDRMTLLSRDEQQTVMTLWSIGRSPLIFGGDLPTLDPFTASLLMNADVIAMNQHSEGARVAYKDGELRGWTAKGVAAGGGAAPTAAATYIALFNLGDTPVSRSVTLQQLGIAQASVALKDLWSGKTGAAGGKIEVHLAPHASALYSFAR